MGQGELFALSAIWAEWLLRCTIAGVLDVVQGVEETWPEPDRLPCDKNWPEIHRCLTGGKSPTGGPPHLHRCFLGSRYPVDPHDGYLATLLQPDEVAELSAALDSLDGEWLRSQCDMFFGPECPEGLPAEWVEDLCDQFEEV